MVEKTMSYQLVVEMPETFHYEAITEDQDLLREAIAMALYHHNKISMKEAIEAMGVSRRVFEDKLAEYGVPMMDENDYLTEINAAKKYPA